MEHTDVPTPIDFLTMRDAQEEAAMQNDQLYMPLDEQRSCLESAGFTVAEILVKGGRALYRAT